MLTTIASSHAKQGIKLELQANSFTQAENRLFHIFVFILMPLFIAFGILYKVVQLEGLALNGTALAIGGVLSFGYFLFQKRQNKSQAVTLKFDEESICLFDKNEELLFCTKKNLKVKKIGWGTETNEMMPAVRISNGLTSFTIGTMESSTFWEKRNGSVDFADYVVSSEEEWTNLMQQVERLTK